MPIGYISRPRLLQRMALGRFVAIEGPTGSGKSLLAAEFLSQPPRSDVQLTFLPVTGAARTRGDFWYDVSTRLAAAGLTEPLEVDDDDHLDNRVDEWLQRFAAAEGRVDLLFDEVDISAIDSVQRDIIRLLEAKPDLRVVAVSSRARKLTSIAASFSPSIVISADDLVLTEEEATRSVGLRVGDATPPLTAMFAGQATATALAIKSGLSDLSEDSLAALHLEVVLGRLSNDEKTDLSALAVPDYALRETLSALCTDVDRALEIAEEFGLLHWNFDAGRPVWSVREPYRGLLRTQLKLEDPVRFRALHSVTARLHLRHGYAVGALKMAAAAMDATVAAEAIDSYWDELTRIHADTVIRTLDGMDSAVLRTNAALQLGLASALRREGEQARAAAVLADAARQLLRSIDRSTPGSHIVDLGRLAAAFQLTGNFRKARECAERVLHAAAALDERTLAGAGVTLHASLVRSAACLLAVGAFEQAEQLATIASAVVAGNTEVTYSAIAIRSAVAAMRGRLNDVRRLLHFADSMSASKHVRFGYRGYLVEIARAVLAVENGNAGEADQMLDAIQDVVEGTQHWPAVLAVRSLVLLARGEPEQGLLLARIRQQDRPDPSPGASEYLAYVRSILGLAVGRHREVRRTLRAANLLRTARGSLLSLLEGNPADALITASSAASEADAPAVERVLANAVAAASAHLEGSESAAEQFLKTARILAEEYELWSPFTWLPVEVHPWVQGNLPHGLRWLPPQLFTMTPPTRVELTPREVAVLSAMLDHPSRSEVAQALHVSENTVKTQLRSIYGKLGVVGRDDALLRAAELGLLRA